MLKLYTDAANRPADGLSAAGILIVDGAKTIERSLPLPNSDNHAAEFAAATAGMQILLELGYKGQNVELISDSQALIDALNKDYSKQYADLLAPIVDLAENFPMVIPTWQNERVNHRAHDLATAALHRREED